MKPDYPFPVSEWRAYGPCAPLCKLQFLGVQATKVCEAFIKDEHRVSTNCCGEKVKVRAEEASDHPLLAELGPDLPEPSIPHMFLPQRDPADSSSAMWGFGVNSLP